MSRCAIHAACAALFLMAAAGGCSSGSFPDGPYALADATLIDGTGSPPLARAVVLVKDGVIQGWLAAGVTSVRDLGPFISDFISERDRLNRAVSNARIIAATPLITRPGGYGSAYIDGPAAARETVRGFIRAGADIIKIAIEDDLQGRKWPMLSGDEIAGAVEEAHAAGRRVSAHISHARNIPLAVMAGVDDLAHMVVEPLSDETAREIAAKGSRRPCRAACRPRGIFWVPTLELWKGVSIKHSLDWDRIAIANTGGFFRAGGRIALGTDFDGYSISFDRGFPITEARLLLEAARAVSGPPLSGEPLRVFSFGAGHRRPVFSIRPMRLSGRPGETSFLEQPPAWRPQLAPPPRPPGRPPNPHWKIHSARRHRHSGHCATEGDCHGSGTCRSGPRPGRASRSTSRRPRAPEAWTSRSTH
jgi:hypothetical protein